MVSAGARSCASKSGIALLAIGGRDLFIEIDFQGVPTKLNASVRMIRLPEDMEEEESLIMREVVRDCLPEIESYLRASLGFFSFLQSKQRKGSSRAKKPAAE